VSILSSTLGQNKGTIKIQDQNIYREFTLWGNRTEEWGVECAHVPRVM